MVLPENLQQKLQERKRNQTYRELKTCKFPVDLCSNDYLGLARSTTLRQAVAAEYANHEMVAAGATGSRLLSGNFAETEELEASLAAFHRAEACLLFNSGYAANTGFFSAVPQRSDTILYDEAIHASIKDGIRLSFAKAFSFRHNSAEDLERRLNRASGNVYVVVEGLYSMHGDLAPLQEMAAVCQQKGAFLVVDEAHSNGIYGERGEGLVAALNLQDQVFARILTFGKALGTHGAMVAGSKALREYLINFSRPFIYTTALPLHTVLTIKNAYKLLPDMHQERTNLKTLSVYLKKVLSPVGNLSLNQNDSPINALGGLAPNKLKELAGALQENGFDARPIFAPTVPAGQECLRLIVHAFNTTTELDELAAATVNYL